MPIHFTVENLMIRKKYWAALEDWLGFLFFVKVHSENWYYMSRYIETPLVMMENKYLLNASALGGKQD